MRSDVGGKFEGGMRKENGQKVERKGEERGKMKKQALGKRRHESKHGDFIFTTESVDVCPPTL